MKRFLALVLAVVFVNAVPFAGARPDLTADAAPTVASPFRASTFNSASPGTGLDGRPGRPYGPVLTVTSVSSTPASAFYKAGQTVSIKVGFNNTVTVTGTPQLTLTNGASAKAVYTSGSGTNSLVFVYTVGAGDTIPHLDYASTSALALNGGTIKSGATSANLTLPGPGAAGSLGANTSIVIDTLAPAVTISAPTPTATTNGTAVSVSYTVTYADANFSSATLSAGSITVNGTETAAGSVSGVVGGAGSSTGTNYTVTIQSVTGYGALGISISSGTATDLAGNSAPSASSSVSAKVMSVPFFTGDSIMANRSYFEMSGLALLVRSNGVAPAQKVLNTSLHDPYSVAWATNGDIYVACYQTPTSFYSSETAADGGVYKIDQYSLAVSPVATSAGFVSDYSTNFVTPFGLAVEPSGTILVADLDAYTNVDANFTDGTVMGGAIFRLDPVTGSVTVLSTNGPTTGSNFFFLGGIAVATNGNFETIYVTDHGDGVNPPTVIQIDATTGAQNVLLSGSPLNTPDGLAVDSSSDAVTNMFVADSGAQGLVQVGFDPNGCAWTGTSLPVTGGSFAFPTHVAIDPGTGDLLVTDGEPASLANKSAGTLWRVYRSDYSMHNWSTGGFFEQPRGIIIQP